MLRVCSPACRAARGLLARSSRHLSSSLMNRVFGVRPMLLDTPFSLLPRLIEEDFTRSLDMLNRAVGGLVHVETDEKTKALKMTFDDMGFYSKLDVSYDKESCLLTVKGEEGEGREKSEATRAVTMPCKVIKPEMITAETRDGCVIVTVPGEAQAPIEEKKLENKKLDVRLVAAGEQPAAIGEQSGATAQKEKAGESYGRSVEQPSPPQ